MRSVSRALAGTRRTFCSAALPYTVRSGSLKTSQISYLEEVPYTLVLPDAYDQTNEAGHPLLLYLAGPGMSSDMILTPSQAFGFLDPTDLSKAQITGIMSRAEAAEVPLAVLCLSCAGHPNEFMQANSAGCGRWSDWSDGSANWESLAVTEIIPHVRKVHNVGSADPALMAVSGISSAGQGALRFGLKHPDVFGVVCGLSAAITPTVTAADLNMAHPNVPFSWRNEEVVFRRDGVFQEEDFHASNPISVASSPSAQEALLRHGTKILIDCGGRDELFPYAGAEMLHRVLADNGIEHEYRLGLHGTHCGSDSYARDMYAIDFIIKHMGKHLRGGATEMDQAITGQLNGLAAAFLQKDAIPALSHGEAMAMVGRQMYSASTIKS